MKLAKGKANGLYQTAYNLTQKIKTRGLESLIDYLNHCDDTMLKNSGHHLDLHLPELKSLAVIDGTKYTRTCIYRCPRYELTLLCWGPGHKTAIHLHDGAECWINLLSGTLHESHYMINIPGKPKFVSSNRLNVGMHAHLNDDIGGHILENDGDEYAVSLHLYTPPIGECTYWDESSQRYLSRTLKFDFVM